LKECALARAVRPDNAEKLAALNRKTDVPERPEIRMKRGTPEGKQFEDAVGRTAVERINLGDPLDKYHGAIDNYTAP
jgi:hypothetical protein